jgi:hypothetical protein
MHKLMIPAFVIALLALGAASGCGTTENGAIISPDVNVRNLCNYNVSVESEDRCMQDSDCTGQYQVCWFSPEEHFQDKKGFCRECQDDGVCSGTTKCDHGWCHEVCASDEDCESNEFCTANFCRKPHMQGTDINFCNDGNKDLEVYLDQVTLHGGDDACVFSRFEWSPPEGTVTLAPDDCSLYLNVKFTPKDVGEFRGFIKIPSNSIKHNPLLIFMCGQAVESVCSVSDDETCPECTSCLQEDFQTMIDNEPTPDCSTYF